MKILWHSVAPWIKTGYGSQTEIFTKRIKHMLGHDVAISSWTSIGGIQDYNGIPVYPRKNDGYGNDVIYEHAKHFGADLVVTLADSWVFDAEVMRKLPWVAWTPVDHDPIPPNVKGVLERGHAVPIAYSHFGVRKMREASLSPQYVPHAAHESYFKKAGKKAARKRRGIPQDAYVVGMVGVNQCVPNRKSYPLCLEAFATFRQKNKDAFLYMHTKRHTAEGVNLNHLIDHLGLPENAYMFTDEYEQLLGFPEASMRDLYASFDVFLTPNIGEGFGIPIIEAQAVGCPIIASKNTTMPELCFFGELVGGQRVYTNQSSFQVIPDLNEIINALERVSDYDEEKIREGARLARRSIKKHYHPDVVTEKHWAPELRLARERVGAWDYS